MAVGAINCPEHTGICQYNVYAVRLRFKAAESVIAALLIQWSYGLVGEVQVILRRPVINETNKITKIIGGVRTIWHVLVV